MLLSASFGCLSSADQPNRSRVPGVCKKYLNKLIDLVYMRKEGRPPKSRFSIALLCLSLLGAAGIAQSPSIAAGEAVAEPPLVEVPNVRGLRPAAAERRLRRWHFGSGYAALGDLCAGVPPGGRILLQQPPAGALAPVFSTVELQDSCHRGAARRKVTVPDVSGGPGILVAYRRLRNRGLRAAIPSSFSVASLCMPSAGAQSPRARARVRRGTVVSLSGLRCALASPGMPVPPPPSVVVPELIGTSLSSAVSWAEAAGLAWQVDELAPLEPSWQMELFDNYVVRAQRPAAGSTATAGMALELGADRRG